MEHGVTGFVDAYHREEDCPGRVEWQILIQTYYQCGPEDT